MPIVSLCRVCRTINREVKDRCSWCGSKQVKATYLNEDVIVKVPMRKREVLIKEN